LSSYTHIRPDGLPTICASALITIWRLALFWKSDMVAISRSHSSR